MSGDMPESEFNTMLAGVVEAAIESGVALSWRSLLIAPDVVVLAAKANGIELPDDVVTIPRADGRSCVISRRPDVEAGGDDATG